MIIDCCSDLHGAFPPLEGGDLLIVAGDLTAKDDDVGYSEFERWLKLQKYKKKIFIAGNHDNQIQKYTFPLWVDGYSEYLCDSGTEFEGLKIWGSPWTPWFHGVHPHCKAFMKKESYIAKKFALIPDDTDILVTHCPPLGVFDISRRSAENCGSLSLRLAVRNRIRPKLHVFGHLHEHGGKTAIDEATIFVNASIMNEDYEATNKPVRIIL